VIAAVAAYTFRRSRQLPTERRAEAETVQKAAPAAELPGPAAGLTRRLPLLSFGTLVTAAIVPLAAGLYLATTTAWTAAERTLLYRRPGPRAEQGLAD
jgi:YidC/Oxa1 family membrane protein insertase